MRKNFSGAAMLRFRSSAVVLLTSVFLSGCATNGARTEASLYPNSAPYNIVQINPPAPVPAVRGYRERVRPTQMNDEQKYAAVYDVPARTDYLANTEPEPAPLPRTTTQPRAMPAPRAYRTANARSDSEPLDYKQIIVTRGDTLYNIAWRYKTTTAALLRANNLRYANLKIGQQLRVPVYR